MIQLLQGDCRDVLRKMDDGSVHCVVTSPPYWGLRDYGVAGQIGLEATAEDFIDEMVQVFREVRRVLRSDGTLWLNIGDSYNANPGQRKSTDKAGPKQATNEGSSSVGSRNVPQLKPKDLVGMPWRLAFALRADGWWLRQDIIWHKPNPMPESIRDRCTKAHEYIFLLSKSERYHYDADAIKEPASDNTHARRKIVPAGWAVGTGPHTSVAHQTAKTHRKVASAGSGIRSNESMAAAINELTDDRNKRSVWTVPTFGFKEAHFATFPPDLIKPCILAGCPEGGTVLDPFGGAGTTGLVADRLQRNAILIELNPDYAVMAADRIYNDGPLFAEIQ